MQEKELLIANENQSEGTIVANTIKKVSSYASCLSELALVSGTALTGVGGSALSTVAIAGVTLYHTSISLANTACAAINASKMCCGENSATDNNEEDTELVLPSEISPSITLA